MNRLDAMEMHSSPTGRINISAFTNPARYMRLGYHSTCPRSASNAARIGPKWPELHQNVWLGA